MQILIFTILGGLMLGAEYLNKWLASQKWLSHQNYFDSSGMFFTCAVGEFDDQALIQISSIFPSNFYF